MLAIEDVGRKIVLGGKAVFGKAGSKGLLAIHRIASRLDAIERKLPEPARDQVLGSHSANGRLIHHDAWNSWLAHDADEGDDGDFQSSRRPDVGLVIQNR